MQTKKQIEDLRNANREAARASVAGKTAPSLEELTKEADKPSLDQLIDESSAAAVHDTTSWFEQMANQMADDGERVASIDEMGTCYTAERGCVKVRLTDRLVQGNHPDYGPFTIRKAVVISSQRGPVPVGVYRPCRAGEEIGFACATAFADFGDLGATPPGSVHLIAPPEFVNGAVERTPVKGSQRTYIAYKRARYGEAFAK